MRFGFVALLAVAALVVMMAIPGASRAQAMDYAGKTVLVTGSTDGLGREIARSLAAEGAHVIVHGRNAERGQALVDEITASGTGSAVFYPADFGSMAAVREFADTIAADFPRLDLLVNNAGILIAGDELPQSADGHDLTFAVNYLSNWILVNRLRPSLAAAAPSRIVNVSSISASPIDFDNVMLEGGNGFQAYGQSKLAQVSMTVELAPAFLADGITMIALHPATMMDTAMVSEVGMDAMVPVEEGRDHVMGLILSPDVEPGAFYIDGAVSPPNHPQPTDPAARARLVALSTELTGVGLAE